MVETPRKRKVTDLSIDRNVDKKRRTKQSRTMALLPMASTVENRFPSQENYDEDEDDGLPPITFLPRVVRTQVQRNSSGTASAHNGVSTVDQTVLQLSSPISEQRQPPIYVVEEEDSRRRHDTSDVVDLTVDSSEVVDLTSTCNNNSVVIITPEQEFLNERPSCRYSGIQITGEKRPSVKPTTSKEPKKKAVDEKENGSTKTGIDVTCPICLDKAEQFRSAGRMLVSTVCGHLFCDDCIKKTVQELHQCPTCRKKLNRKQYHPVYI